MGMIGNRSSGSRSKVHAAFRFSGSMQHFSGERAYFPDQSRHVNELKRRDILSGPKRNATDVVCRVTYMVTKL
jgi:hypothetical protein